MEIQIPQILFQIVNFSVVLGALTYFLYKPILQVLEDRAKKIEAGQIAAQKALTEQQQIEELKKQAKKDAEKKAAEILAQAKKDADAHAQDLNAKAQEHAKAQILKFQEEWKAQKQELAKELKQQFADAVVTAAEKVVSVSLDKKAQTKVIDDELTALLKSM